MFDRFDRFNRFSLALRSCVVEFSQSSLGCRLAIGQAGWFEAKLGFFWDLCACKMTASSHVAGQSFDNIERRREVRHSAKIVKWLDSHHPFWENHGKATKTVLELMGWESLPLAMLHVFSLIKAHGYYPVWWVRSPGGIPLATCQVVTRPLAKEHLATFKKILPPCDSASLYHLISSYIFKYD